MNLRITTDMDPERALFADTNLPARYRSLGLGVFGPATHPVTDGPAAQALDWFKGLPAQQRVDQYGVPLDPVNYGRGLLLAGPPGTGKTTLAAAVACDVRRAHKSVYYIRWPDYVDRARSLMGDFDPDIASRVLHTLDRVADAFLVVLDDVGHEHTTASRYAEDLLEQVIRDRHEKGRPTIVTTNLNIDGWKNRYSAALLSFMSEATVRIPVVGPDLRGNSA